MQDYHPRATASLDHGEESDDASGLINPLVSASDETGNKFAGNGKMYAEGWRMN